MSNKQKVHDFHTIYKCNISNTPGFPNQNERELRKNLLMEEYKEYTDAEESNNFVEVCDALADMLYIIYGTAVSYGIPIDEIFQEVHNSNLSKLGEDGKPIYREDGKVQKGPNFFKPDICKILKEFGYQDK
jgi:predicted HAD superfamily Cof-like phosphohydrolase